MKWLCIIKRARFSGFVFISLAVTSDLSVRPHSKVQQALPYVGWRSQPSWPRKLRTLTFEPSTAESSMLSVLPMRPQPYIDKLDPKRPKLRSESALPQRCRHSSTTARHSDCIDDSMKAYVAVQGKKLKLRQH